MSPMVFRTAAFRVVVRCCLAVYLQTATISAAPPTVEQVQQALDIAELSAHNQLIDLSQKAVQRALQSGPPTVSTATPPPSVQTVGSRIDIMRPVQAPPVQIVRTRITKTVRQLSEVWRQQGDPQRLYETLRSIVLPPNRPNELFLYASPGTANTEIRMPDVYCVGHELIRSAAAAERIPDLIQSIQSRGLDHSDDATLLLLLCALETNDGTGVSKYSERLGQILVSGSNPDSVQLAANAGILVRRKTDDAKAAADILYAAAKTSLTINRYDSESDFGSTAIAREGIRSCFAARREHHAIELLKLCLAGEDQHPQRQQSTTDAGGTRELVARELYGRGLIPIARDLLGQKYAQGFESRYRHAALLNSDQSQVKPLATTAPVRTKARVLPIDESLPAADIEDQIWICALNTETAQSQVLLTLPDFQNVTSPVVSPDGQQLAFAATFPAEVVTSDSRIYVAAMDGTSIRELGSGTLPSWSPGGRRLVCSRYSPNRGVWLVRVDSASFRLLDENGWSGRWSPDGTKIAYIKPGGNGTDFVITDLVENESSRIATGSRTSTAQSSWNFCWSPNSVQVVVEALGNSARGQFGHATLSVFNHDSNPQLSHSADYFNADLAWWPQRSAVLMAPNLKKYQAERVHALNTGTSELTYVSGQFSDRRNSGMSWMPDGKTLIYLSRRERR